MTEVIQDPEGNCVTDESVHQGVPLQLESSDQDVQNRFSSPIIVNAGLSTMMPLQSGNQYGYLPLVADV